jgi:predicted transcriptional regulator YdeE
MKKFFTFLVACFAMCFSLCSCSVGPKTFTKAGVTITLTSEYKEKEVPNIPAYYETSNTMVMVTKEKRDDLSMGWAYTRDKSDYYGNDVWAHNNYFTYKGTKAPCFVLADSNDGGKYAYTIYRASTESGEFTYYIVAICGEEYCYLINMAARLDEFDQYKDQFVEYAKSITVE